MAELCNVCSSLQDQLLADGDGSQVVCICNVELSQQQTDNNNNATSESTTKVQSGKKRARNNFISTAEFDTKVSKNKPKDVMKWCDLPLHIIFKVKGVKEVTVIRHGEETISRIGKLENKAGELTNLWLTSVIEKELLEVQDFDNEQVYIRSLGIKNNKDGTRKYYNFDIIKH